MQVEPATLWAPGKERKRVAARSLLCYWIGALVCANYKFAETSQIGRLLCVLKFYGILRTFDGITLSMSSMNLMWRKNSTEKSCAQFVDKKGLCDVFFAFAITTPICSVLKTRPSSRLAR